MRGILIRNKGQPKRDYTKVPPPNYFTFFSFGRLRSYTTPYKKILNPLGRGARGGRTKRKRGENAGRSEGDRAIKLTREGDPRRRLPSFSLPPSPKATVAAAHLLFSTSAPSGHARPPCQIKSRESAQRTDGLERDIDGTGGEKHSFLHGNKEEKSFLP